MSTPAPNSAPPASKPRIVLGVCGGIAAYKICELASRLTQENFDVHVVMTQSATRFVAPLTFQALTQNPVHTTLWPESTQSESGVAAAMAHIELAARADVILIAPATANFIAKLAHGIADDLLSTLLLATRAQVLVAPAMNPLMLSHPATQKNLEVLQSYGYEIIEPDVGRMACEHFGAGRLPRAEILYSTIIAKTASQKISQSLKSKRVLITAGPTRENLDPVRFLSNRSSGKMGFALAEAAAARGAEVLLVSGPSSLETPRGVSRVDVETTRQMFEAATQRAPHCDIIIGAAAPADFSVQKISGQKIKKRGDEKLAIELIATPDIIAHLGKQKTAKQIVVGFAAETGNGIAEAQGKLQSKNLDAIVFNDVTQEGAGFDVETNRVTWIDARTQDEWPLLSKREVASRILERASILLAQSGG